MEVTEEVSKAINASVPEDQLRKTAIHEGMAIIKRFPGEKLPEVIDKYPEVAQHLFGILVSRLDHANKITVKLINDLTRMKNSPG